ncbi:hypothetical protein MH928_09440 [Flavobacterium sp. WW92]|uniref:hypothetical protein n=1 Tax=unclassified Flavobacterium TaxID=196869 RepID=UPI002225176D|nr:MULTISPECIES: hypothetical protein [unclassified Flavobacterium]WDO11555.1 hypothetical protein MH928_09440 [Flavobacterium sp. WW92]
MNYNKKRHELLEIIYSNGDYPDVGDNTTFASFNLDELKGILRISKVHTVLLLRTLIDTGEIVKLKEDLFTISTLGMHACTTNKYLKAYRKSIIDNIKDVASIVVPILSLIVAIMAIALKSDSVSKKDFQKLHERLEELEKKSN